MNLRKPLLAALLSLASCAAFAAVDVNKADANELQSIKGLGTSMSNRIVEARKDGSFKDWDDLQTRVRGIGPMSAAKLSAEGLTLDGGAFGQPKPAPAKPSKSSGKTAAAATTPAPTPAPAKK